MQAQPSDAKEKAIEALKRVRIARPEERYHAYPFELSGGMCQRVVIALALACQPQLLIADEPTTGLDVTTQKAVMDLVVELTRERGMSTILITHDLGLAAAYCDKVVVMEKGKVVETAAVRDHLQGSAARLYPQADARDAAARRVACAICCRRTGRAPSRRRRRRKRRAADKTPLLVVSNLVKEYAAPGRDLARLASFFRKKDQLPQAETFKAVDGISFEIKRGESVGLVGESGCGKSTTSMMVMRLLDPTSGIVTFDGEDIGSIPAREFAKSPMRKRIQMVFQDPTESLNPRFTAVRAIADPILRMSDIKGGDAVRARCEELARNVGLPVELLDRFPHQLSGGQKARVGIARAIALSSRTRDSRRADRGARRVGAGGGAQPARGFEAFARHELSFRLARSQRGAAALRPRDRDADRQDRGGGQCGSR